MLFRSLGVRLYFMKFLCIPAFCAIVLLTSCHKEEQGVCDYSFCVFDAKTMEALPNYAFTMPSINGNTISGSTLYRNANCGFFYAPTSSAVSIKISAPGYSDFTVSLEPKFGSTSGPLPEQRKVFLSKAEQDAAANP